MLPDIIPPLSDTCRFLCDPKLDGRHPGSTGHETARRYLCDLLEALDFSPLFDDGWSQPVMDGTAQIGTNIGGIKPGVADRFILLGAHYDHFEGIPGADDNAAALSILLATSRLLSPWTGEHNLVLCFFDLEEPPYFMTGDMGSMFFTQHAPFDLSLIDCAIILDLCGHDVPIPGCEDAVFALGAESSTDLIQAIRSLQQQKIPVYMFSNDRIGDMSDHHAFRIRQVPFLFFSCGQWEHYHQPSDTFDKLNLDKMQRMAECLAGLTRYLDHRTVTWQPVPDFWQVEAESLRQISGLPLPDSKQLVDNVINGLIRQLVI